MLKISKDTTLQPEQILDKAVAFFGPDGEQLQEKDRDACCVSFEGGGGYVRVSVAEEGDAQTVDVETREFEYQARQFLNRL